MSKTVSVGFDGRWLWAYDVSLAILLLEAIHVALETPAEHRRPRTDAVLEGMRIQVRVGADAVFVLDNENWDDQQRSFVHLIIARAGQRLRERPVITAAEAADRYTIDGEPHFLRGHEQINGGVVADLADAIERLVSDELPPVPDRDRRWYFGVEGGPRLL
jgi:hypothetical protein